MPVQKREIPAQFISGIDAGGKDPKIVQEELLRLENGIFPRRGSISKRNGTSNFFTSVTGDTLGTFEGSPFVFNTRLTTSGTTASTEDAEIIDSESSVVFVNPGQVLGQNAYGGANHIMSHDFRDSSSNRRIRVYLVGDTGEIVDTGTFDGNTFLRNVVEASPSGSTTKYAYFIDTTGPSLVYFSMGPTSVTGPTAVGSLTASPEDRNGMDAIALLDGTNTVVSYTEATTMDGVVAVLDGTRAETASNVIASTVGQTIDFKALTTVKDSSNTDFFAWAFYESGTNTLSCVVYDSTLTTQYGAVITTNIGTDSVYNLTILHTSSSSTRLDIFLERSTTSTDMHYVDHIPVTLSGTAPSGSMAFGSRSTLAFGAIPVSRPIYTTSDDIYLPIYWQSGRWWDGSVEDSDRIVSQRIYFLLKLDATTPSDSKVVAKFLPGRAGASQAHFADNNNQDGVNLGLQSLEVLPKPEDWDFSGLNLWNVPAQKFVSNQTIAPVQWKVDLNPSRVRTDEANEVTYIPGGLPMEYDGRDVVEQGFITHPEKVGVSAKGATGSWDRTGTVSFITVYEWVDDDGNIHQSSPSPILNANITATTDDFTINTEPYPVWSKKSDVRAVLYMTEIDGDRFYRVQDIGAQQSVNAILFAIVVGTETLFVDQGGDILSARGTLYTQDGEIENIQPPPHRVSTIHHNRHFCVDRESENERIVFSKGFIKGEGTGYTDILEIRVNPAGGRMTGLHSFDEKLVIFKETSIYITHGRGPDASGAGVGFERPRLVTNAVGCVNAKTIVLVPNGLMFLARDGIYILDHSEQVQFVGHPVRFHTDTLNITAGAVSHDGRFAIWSASDGNALVYNYLYNQWATFTGNYSNVSDIVEAGNLLYSLNGTTVHQENVGNYLDASSPYSLKLETGWFSFSNLLGYMRMYNWRLLADNISDHKLRIKTAYDFDPYWVDEQTFDSDDLQKWDFSAHLGAMSDANRVDNSYKIEVHGSRQKVDSVRMSIEDEALGGTNNEEAIALTGISFLVGVKSGLTRLGTARRVVDGEE